MIVRLEALSSNMTLEITRATSTYELQALRLVLAFSGHVTGMPQSFVGWTTIVFYDVMMASGYTIVSLQMDSYDILFPGKLAKSIAGSLEKICYYKFGSCGRLDWHVRDGYSRIIM